MSPCARSMATDVQASLITYRVARLLLFLAELMHDSSMCVPQPADREQGGSVRRGM